LYKHEALKSITNTFIEIFFHSDRCYLFLYQDIYSLPASILKLQKVKLIFKSALRKYLVMHAFYFIEEFLSYDEDVV
jgi:hypothetical protein